MGPINIQPSEICKFSLIIYISGYSVRRMTEINSLRSFLKPLFLLFVISCLILIQPDLGSVAIICFGSWNSILCRNFFFPAFITYIINYFGRLSWNN